MGTILCKINSRLVTHRTKKLVAFPCYWDFTVENLASFNCSRYNTLRYTNSLWQDAIYWLSFINPALCLKMFACLLYHNPLLNLRPSLINSFLIFGLPQQLSNKLNNPTIRLPNNIILSPVDSARNLGVMLIKICHLHNISPLFLNHASTIFVT